MAKKSQDMNILDVKKIVDGLNVCRKICGADKFNMVFGGKNCHICMQSDLNKVDYLVEDCLDAEQKGEVSFNVETFLGSIGRFGKCAFAIEDTTIKFKSGKSSGNITTQPYEEIVVLPEKVESLFNFDTLKDIILKVLPSVCITPTPHLSQDESALEVIIEGSKEGIKFLCADRYHGVLATVNQKSEKFKLNFPLTYTNLLSLFDKKFELSMDSNCIYLHNKKLKLCVPQIVCNSVVDVNGFVNLFESSKKEFTIKKFSIGEFEEALNSASSVLTEAVDICMKIKNGTMKVYCSSELGEVSTDIDVEAKKDMPEKVLQYDTIYDVLDICDKKATLNVYENFLQFGFTKDDVEYIVLGTLGEYRQK